jgi:hypothetical protein
MATNKASTESAAMPAAKMAHYLDTLPLYEAAALVWGRMVSSMHAGTQSGGGHGRALELFRHRSGRVDAAEIQKALERIGISGVSLKVHQQIFYLACFGLFRCFRAVL